MKWTFRLLAIAFFGMGMTAISHASEKTISRSDLPAAVQKAAQEQSRGATVKGYTQDSENGQLEYEVEMMVNGHSKDVSIDRNGSILEIEEQVERNRLPASVQSGLRERAGKARITKIESITKHGSIVAYEAQVRSKGKHSEIQVGPDGEPLDHEE